MHKNSSGRDRVKVQGWCPTGWRPMRAHDGWIVRIRPHCASMSAEQWAVLADLALSHAHPEIELTRLGNMQLRGISEAHLAAVHATLMRAGLLCADEDTDQAPAVHCTPLYRTGDPTHALAVLLSQAVQTRLSPRALQGCGLQALPSKFGFAVDDSRRRMKTIAADLCLWVRCDGRYGLGLGGCSDVFCFDKAADAVAAAVELGQWFADERMAITPTPTRLKSLGLRAGGDLPCLAKAARCADTESAAPVLPGLLEDGRRVLGVPLGRIDAAAMHRVARHMPSDAEIRVTPWRSLIFDSASLASELALAEPAYWIAQADDDRLRISACTGAPGCSQALVAVQELALLLAPQLPEKTHLHLSACAKCCALSPEATAVLLAVEGAEGQAVFNACLPDQIPRAVAQISPQALRDKPNLISQLIYDLHI